MLLSMYALWCYVSTLCMHVHVHDFYSVWDVTLTLCLVLLNQADTMSNMQLLDTVSVLTSYKWYQTHNNNITVLDVCVHGVRVCVGVCVCVCGCGYVWLVLLTHGSITRYGWLSSSNTTAALQARAPLVQWLQCSMVTQPLNVPLAMWTAVLTCNKVRCMLVGSMVSHVVDISCLWNLGVDLWKTTWWVSLSVPLQVSGKGPGLGLHSASRDSYRVSYTLYIWLPTHSREVWLKYMECAPRVHVSLSSLHISISHVVKISCL